MTKKPVIQDLYTMSEDERIDRIGQAAMGGPCLPSIEVPRCVGFVVEDDVKAQRYINKLLAKYPLEVVDKCKDSLYGLVTVRVRPATKH